MMVRHALGAVVSTALVLSWAAPASAYRPFDGTDAAVAEAHVVELEVGPVGYERQSTAKYLVAPALVLNYGVAPGFELVLEGRQLWALHEPDDSGLEEVALSLKSVLRRGSLQGAKGVSVAMESGLLLPGTDARLGVHVASIFSWQWPAVTVHLNLMNDLLTSLRYAASSSVIAEGPSQWLVRPVSEVLVVRDFAERAVTRGSGASVLVGAIAEWNDAWAFDVAVRHGVREGRTEDEVRLGFTWSFSAE
jgi:hypothetical protein